MLFQTQPHLPQQATISVKSKLNKGIYHATCAPYKKRVIKQATALITCKPKTGLLNPPKLLLIFLCLSFVLSLCLPPKAQAWGETISINRVYDYQKDKQLLIDSESTFWLPNHVIQAINSEVPLNFRIQIELTEDSKLLGIKYQRTRKQIDFDTELRASGVKRIYTLYNTRNSKTQSFTRLEEALKTLSTLQAFPIASLSELHPQQRYTLRMRIRLDTLQLPTPLLAEALFSDKWTLDSEWYETTLQTPLSWQ